MRARGSPSWRRWGQMRPSPSCLGSGCFWTSGRVYRPARTRCRPEAAAAAGRNGEGDAFRRMLSGLQLVYGAAASPAEPPQLRPARGCSGHFPSLLVHLCKVLGPWIFKMGFCWAGRAATSRRCEGTRPAGRRAGHGAGGSLHASHLSIFSLQMRCREHGDCAGQDHEGARSCPQSWGMAGTRLNEG